MQIVSLQAMSKDELIALLLKERQEHSDTLDAIGAGGIGRNRITSKTLDEHRAEFEAEQEYGLERCDEGYYINIDTLNNWGFWKAARGICEPGTRDCDPD